MLDQKIQRHHRLPDASVITPYAGGGTLIALLQGLDGQTVGKELWELIIATERELPADVMSLLEHSNIRARVVFCDRQYEPNRHSGGYLRNRGALVARSELLIFIDSDCVPSPNCVGIHVAAHRDSARRDLAVCGGMRELSALAHAAQSLNLGYPSIEKFAGDDFRGNQTRSAYWQDFYSANVSIGLKAFDAVCGFDESGLRCHDMDLGYRLHKQGCVFRLLPRSAVIHIEHPRSIQSRLHQAEGWVLLGKKCPEIGDVCERQAKILANSFGSISALCEKQFVALTRGMPGFRVERSWVISPKGLRRLWRRMSAIPHCVQTSENGVQINLRLHRSCWDYSIHIRKPASVNAKKKPRITVVLTTYNHAQLLDHAVTSVLMQTEQDFELLIIDDASEDDTCHALATYARDPRIRIYTNPENIGLSQCLNKALELAKADFILQLDADDYLLPSAVAKVLEQFRDADVGAVCAGHRGRQLAKNPSASLAILGSLTQTAPRAYRVSAAKRVGGWLTGDGNSGRYFEDRLMLARMAEGRRVARVDKALYRVREVGNSLSRRGDYQAISAKLSIVTDFANERALDVRFAPRGITVKPLFRRRIRSAVHKKWSIVIPCFSNAPQLQYTLAAWQETDLVREGAEIVVVDDGSKRPIERDVSDTAIRIVRLPTRTGAANARNCGARVARGEMLMFCDGDHVVPPDCGMLHERTHLSLPRAGAVVGVVRGRRALTVGNTVDMPAWVRRTFMEFYRFNDAPKSAFSSLVSGGAFATMPIVPDLFRRLSKFSFSDGGRQRWGELLHRHGDMLRNYPHAWMALAGGCVSISRALFEGIGGFRKDFPSMEDWELGARLQTLGAPIAFVPAAEPLHQWHHRDPHRVAHNRLARRKLMSAHPALVQALLKDDLAVDLPGRELLGTDREGTAHSRQIKRRARSHRLEDRDVYLTFDDGPDATGTTAILEVLDSFQAKGTFFFLGERVEALPNLCRQVARRGHEIGVHAWDHSDLERKSLKRVSQALGDSLDAISSVVRGRIRYARPPYGRLTRNYTSAARKLGLRAVLWDVSSGDWGCGSSFEVMRNLASRPLAGRIVLLHDGCGDPTQTAAALRRLLREMCSHGMSTSTLNRRTSYG